MAGDAKKRRAREEKAKRLKESQEAAQAKIAEERARREKDKRENAERVAKASEEKLAKDKEEKRVNDIVKKLQDDFLNIFTKFGLTPDLKQTLLIVIAAYTNRKKFRLEAKDKSEEEINCYIAMEIVAKMPYVFEGTKDKEAGEIIVDGDNIDAIVKILPENQDIQEDFLALRERINDTNEPAPFIPFSSTIYEKGKIDIRRVPNLFDDEVFSEFARKCISIYINSKNPAGESTKEDQEIAEVFQRFGLENSAVEMNIGNDGKMEVKPFPFINNNKSPQ